MGARNWNGGANSRCSAPSRESRRQEAPRFNALRYWGEFPDSRNSEVYWDESLRCFMRRNFVYSPFPSTAYVRVGRVIDGCSTCRIVEYPGGYGPRYVVQEYSLVYSGRGQEEWLRERGWEVRSGSRYIPRGNWGVIEAVLDRVVVEEQDSWGYEI